MTPKEMRGRAGKIGAVAVVMFLASVLFLLATISTIAGGRP